MKIKSIAAVGAMSAGLGIASFLGGTGTASADCGEATTPILERANCLVSQDLAGFANSTDPFVAADQLLNGDPSDTPYGSLGLNHQLDTFKNSIVGTEDTAGFLGGPISSLDPKAP